MQQCVGSEERKNKQYKIKIILTNVVKILFKVSLENQLS